MRTPRVTAIALLLLASSGTPAADPVAVFEEGKRIIEENHPESASASDEGTLRGAIRVEEALALGYSDKVAAYRLLGKAYSRIGGFGRYNPQLKAEYRVKARQAYEQAARLAPHDADLLMELAGVQPYQQSLAKALRAVLEANPNHADALYLLGRDLVGGTYDRTYSRRERSAQMEEGVRLLKRAAAHARGEYAEERRSDIAAILTGSGHRKEAEEIRRAYGLRKPKERSPRQ